jgi:flagellin-like hook-associated protein FlgL
MIKLSRYFDNPFDDPEISGEEFRIFSEDHLGKLRAHDAAGPQAGTLTDMVTATQAAFTAFDAALSTQAEQIGTQKTGTATKDEVLRLFRTTIRQREGRVRDKLGEATAAYREIFPGGLSYYTRTTMQNAQQRIDYAVDKFTKYQTELGPELKTEFTGLSTSFANARTGQVGEKSDVGAARSEVRATRSALELQVLGNLLALAGRFKGEPDRAAEFFTQSLLEDPTRSQATDDPTTPAT